MLSPKKLKNMRTAAAWRGTHKTAQIKKRHSGRSLLPTTPESPVLIFIPIVSELLVIQAESGPMSVNELAICHTSETKPAETNDD
jgi:hypothetical protein